MKLRILVILLPLLLISCGKKDEPEQAYIVMDEKSSESSTSTNSKLDKVSTTKLLSGVSFADDTCESNSVQVDIMIFSDKIQSLGGTVNEVYSYEASMNGLQKFLNDSGVNSVSAPDLSLAGTSSKMKSCGLKDLTPPKSCWYRTLTLALLSEKIEKDTGVDLKVTSHYRDECYNETVGGASTSDHISAKALDISLGNQSNRHKVEQYICDQFWEDNFFGSGNSSDLDNISIGIGETFLHLGIDSIHGRRHWIYDNYLSNNTMPSTCWKKI
jgi:hypothetical protein